MTAPQYATIEGRRVLVVEQDRGLPRKMQDLLSAMARFGFAFREDFAPAGARTACEQLREHRLERFREGRWWNPRRFVVYGDHPGSSRVIDAGLLTLALSMCRDCGAVCVRDVTPEMWAGARPARLVNRVTGTERIAPAVLSRNVILGWYSGARRAGREYL